MEPLDDLLHTGHEQAHIVFLRFHRLYGLSDGMFLQEVHNACHFCNLISVSYRRARVIGRVPTSGILTVGQSPFALVGGLQ